MLVTAAELSLGPTSQSPGTVTKRESSRQWRIGALHVLLLFYGDDDPLTAGNVRAMLGLKGDPAEVVEVMSNSWRSRLSDAEKEVQKNERIHKTLTRRYKAALDRCRLSRELPGESDLDKIQRYEADLERGLHKALERLQALQEARGANPRIINLAVVQGSFNEPEVASFGNSNLETERGDLPGLLKRGRKLYC